MVDVAELMDIPAPRGRRSALHVSKRRDMLPTDIVSLSQAKPLEQVSPVSQLRHQHHLLARLIAEGKSLTEASYITGYSVTYISRLKTQDKAFQELIAYYESNVQEIYYSVHEMLKGLGLNTVQELLDRLASDPDSFKNYELMELLTITMDRAGYGPTSTTKIHHTGLTAEDISQLKTVITARSHGTVRLISPANTGADLGEVIDASPTQTEEAQRLPSERDDLPANGREMAEKEHPL